MSPASRPVPTRLTLSAVREMPDGKGRIYKFDSCYKYKDKQFICFRLYLPPLYLKKQKICQNIIKRCEDSGAFERIFYRGTVSRIPAQKEVNENMLTPWKYIPAENPMTPDRSRTRKDYFETPVLVGPEGGNRGVGVVRVSAQQMSEDNQRKRASREQIEDNRKEAIRLEAEVNTERLRVEGEEKTKQEEDERIRQEVKERTRQEREDRIRKENEQQENERQENERQENERQENERQENDKLRQEDDAKRQKVPESINQPMALLTPPLLTREQLSSNQQFADDMRKRKDIYDTDKKIREESEKATVDRNSLESDDSNEVEHDESNAVETFESADSETSSVEFIEDTYSAPLAGNKQIKVEKDQEEDKNLLRLKQQAVEEADKRLLEQKQEDGLIKERQQKEEQEKEQRRQQELDEAEKKKTEIENLQKQQQQKKLNDKNEAKLKLEEAERKAKVLLEERETLRQQQEQQQEQQQLQILARNKILEQQQQQQQQANLVEREKEEPSKGTAFQQQQENNQPLPQAAASPTVAGSWREPARAPTQLKPAEKVTVVRPTTKPDKGNVRQPIEMSLAF